jgi:hypothetical protein
VALVAVVAAPGGKGVGEASQLEDQADPRTWREQLTGLCSPECVGWCDVTEGEGAAAGAAGASLVDPFLTHRGKC